MSRAVLPLYQHINSVKEMVRVDKAINVGTRKEPSKEAVDKFIQIYLEIINRHKNLKRRSNEK